MNCSRREGTPAAPKTPTGKRPAIDPGLNLGGRIAATAERARESRLPAEFRAALTAPQITRGDLGGTDRRAPRGSLLQRAPCAQVVVTDTQGHWAAPWITETASAGIIEPFENHTFQPSDRWSAAEISRRWSAGWWR